MKVFALLAVAVLGSCPSGGAPPNPPPQPIVDASPVEAAPEPPPTPPSLGVCGSACSNMTTLGCGGVNPKTCAEALANTEHDHVFVNEAGRPISCRCIAQAATRAGVEACGVGCR